MTCDIHPGCDHAHDITHCAADREGPSVMWLCGHGPSSTPPGCCLSEYESSPYPGESGMSFSRRYFGESRDV